MRSQVRPGKKMGLWQLQRFYSIKFFSTLFLAWAIPMCSASHTAPGKRQNFTLPQLADYNWQICQVSSSIVLIFTTNQSIIFTSFFLFCYIFKRFHADFWGRRLTVATKKSLRKCWKRDLVHLAPGVLWIQAIRNIGVDGKCSQDSEQRYQKSLM